MHVIVNGEERELSTGTTVRQLLVSLGLGETLVAVERNRAIVPRGQHAEAEIEPGDTIEIVHFVGGG